MRLARLRRWLELSSYRSSTRAVLLAYAVLLASKKSVFTMLAFEYWLTHAMSAGSVRYPSQSWPNPNELQRRLPRYLI